MAAAFRAPHALRLALALGLCLPLACRANEGSQDAALPAVERVRWTAADRAAAFARFSSFDQPVGAAVARTHLIAGTTGSPAVAAGNEVLRAGGSAVDAVLTAALGQVVLAAQSWVSFGGFLTLVVFDPETNAVHSLDACFAIPRGETEPLTIPTSAAAGDAGRTVLVPGFFAGLEAAHERFGKLPFRSLFDPAIELAEGGFPLPVEVASAMASARERIVRAPGTRQLLLKPDQTCYAAGELFAQPELARTLREIAARGTAYVRTGPWAERFCELVRAEGGRVTLEDLAAYRVRWSEPARTRYHGFEVCALGAPGFGGTSVIEALNVLAEADLRALEDPVERLFWWIQITQLQSISFLDRPTLALLFPGDASAERRLTQDWARELWARVQAGDLPLTRPIGGTHSDALVAVDRSGQVAALVHTSNTANPWATGIVVDGISIPDPACFQQGQLARAGPGALLPDPTNPLIVLRDGRPVLASASIGAGLHAHTLQRVVAVLDEGLDPSAALALPSVHLAAWDLAGRATAQVSRGAFDAELLELVRLLGQPIRELDEREVRAATGYWTGIRIDPGSGQLAGACPARLNGGIFGE